MTTEALAPPPATIRQVVFMGTPEAAVPCLHALMAAGYDLPLVISQPDRRRGRGSKRIPSPVKAAAIDLGLAVGDDPDALLELDSIDLAVVVAYGRLIRRPLLERVPMVNVHFSLLPRWRGAAPVERAILAGDRITGVSIMQLTEGLDEGPVFAMSEMEIGPNESASVLTGRLAELGAELLVATMAGGRTGGLPDPSPQQGEMSYAKKIDRSEFALDFSQTALELHRRVRVGRSWTTFRGRRFGIEEARVIRDVGDPGCLKLSDSGEFDCDVGLDGPVILVGAGENSLALIKVKPEGRRVMDATDWWNGAQPEAGERLGL